MLTSRGAPLHPQRPGDRRLDELAADVDRLEDRIVGLGELERELTALRAEVATLTRVWALITSVVKDTEKPAEMRLMV